MICQPIFYRPTWKHATGSNQTEGKKHLFLGCREIAPVFDFWNPIFYIGFCSKYKGKRGISGFFAFFSNFFPFQGVSIPWINLSVQYGSFDTHIDILNDILCHMAYVIKCRKMAKYGILWHFMTYAIWHKMSLSMSIWVSKEPYRSDKLICGIKQP